MKKLMIPITLLLITGCEQSEWAKKQEKAVKESDTTIYITSGKHSNTYYTKRRTIEFPTPTCIQFTELENLSTIYSCAPYTINYKQQY